MIILCKHKFNIYIVLSRNNKTVTIETKSHITRDVYRREKYIDIDNRKSETLKNMPLQRSYYRYIVQNIDICYKYGAYKNNPT